VSQVKTARIKKSAKEQLKNEENKHKGKNIKGNNKIKKDDSLAAMEAKTKTEDFPQFAWLD
jgi:predicted RNA-binding protein with PUA domain